MAANPGGLTGLRRIQIGKEITPGTAVAASVKLLGFQLGHMLGDRKKQHPSDDRGELAESFRSFTSQYDWKDMLKGNASFEMMPYLCRMAIKGAVTGVVTDTSAYTYTYAPSLTAANNPDTCTVEFGDDAQAYRVPFAFGSDLMLSGQLDQAVQAEMTVEANHISQNAFTGALSDTSIEDVIVANTKLYIDATGGTIGTTQVTGKLLDWQWKLPKHFMPGHRQDGTLDFVRITEAKMQPTLQLTIESAEAQALASAFTGDTRQLVRLISTGTLVGAVTQKKTLQIDGAYNIDHIDKFEDKDGVNVVKVNLIAEYDSTWGKLFQIVVVNGNSTIV